MSKTNNLINSIRKILVKYNKLAKPAALSDMGGNLLHTPESLITDLTLDIENEIAHYQDDNDVIPYTFRGC